jgi:hypothetical protein
MRVPIFANIILLSLLTVFACPHQLLGQADPPANVHTIDYLASMTAPRLDWPAHTTLASPNRIQDAQAMPTERMRYQCRSYRGSTFAVECPKRSR